MIITESMQPLSLGKIPSFDLSESIAPLTWLTDYCVMTSYCLMPRQRHDSS